MLEPLSYRWHGAYSSDNRAVAEAYLAAHREDQESAEGHTDASDYNGK